MKKITVAEQGKVIIEHDVAGGFLIMFPDGNVAWKETKRYAENAARRWFKENLKDGSIGVGAIEWREDS